MKRTMWGKAVMVAAAAAAMVAVSAGTASAASEWNWTSSSWDSDRGVGDQDVQVAVHHSGTNPGSVQATFRGYGEHLVITDNLYDGFGAVAYLTVGDLQITRYGTEGETIDINLDYPEGLDASLQVCNNDGSSAVVPQHCSADFAGGRT